MRPTRPTFAVPIAVSISIAASLAPPSPAGAVVGPSREPSGAVVDSAVMVLQRRGAAAGAALGSTKK